MTKPQLPNRQQTVVNTILITNISTSNNLNKFWVGIFTRQGHIKFTEQELVSESVSQLVSDKHCQWSDSGPIITYGAREASKNYLFFLKGGGVSPNPEVTPPSAEKIHQIDFEGFPYDRIH